MLGRGGGLLLRSRWSRVLGRLGVLGFEIGIVVLGFGFGCGECLLRGMRVGSRLDI